MSESKIVPVVCALIEREGRVLIAQRPAHKHLGLAWEFPGGKVESGESPENALVREILEELGCHLQLSNRLPTRRHSYTAVTIEMTPFVATLASGSAEPHAKEHLSLQWIDPEQLKKFNLAPADVPVVADYLAFRRP